MKYAKLTPGIGFSPVQSVLYYTQRLVTIPALRRFCIFLIKTTVRLFRQSDQYADKLLPDQRILPNILNRSGYVPLGKLLTQSQCSDIHSFLTDKELSDRHNSANKFTLDNVPEAVRLADYHLRDIANCPHLLDLANSPMLLGLAEQYIGCAPTISAMGLRWSFPTHAGESSLQSFHRDADDWRFVKVMVYLTDVGHAEGPHMFILGTHLDKATARLHYYSDASIYARYGHDQVATALGECGSAFAVDTAGIHKGNAPSGNARLLLQIQYSLLPNYSYTYDPEAYEGSCTLDPYINRLIVAPGAGYAEH